MKANESRDRGVPVVSAQCVRDGGGKIAVPIPAACLDRHSQPVVELIREGEIVKAIEIVCPCGARIRLMCDYARPATNKSA